MKIIVKKLTVNFKHSISVSCWVYAFYFFTYWLWRLSYPMVYGCMSMRLICPLIRSPKDGKTINANWTLSNSIAGTSNHTWFIRLIIHQIIHDLYVVYTPYSQQEIYVDVYNTYQHLHALSLFKQLVSFKSSIYIKYRLFTDKATLDAFRRYKLTLLLL